MKTCTTCKHFLGQNIYCKRDVYASRTGLCTEYVKIKTFPQKEIWKKCYDYPTYKVSTCGRIRNLCGKIMKTHVLNNGYVGISLRKNNKSIHKCLHRLVALTFLEMTTPKLETNHKNGDRQDNRICNLELVTHSDNFKHGHRTGLMRSRKGEGHWINKLSSSQIKNIRLMYKDGTKQSTIAVIYETCQSNVSRIVNKKNWSHI